MENMLKRLLSFAIVLVMVIGMIPGNTFYGLAAEETDSVIDTEAELSAALEAGGEVTLGGNVTVTETITIPAGVTATLNLNGYTISQEKACTASYSMITNMGTLTVTGEGKISFTDTSAGDPNFGWGAYTLANYGTLVVENGTIENLSKQNTPGNVVHMYCAIQQGSGAVSTTINGGKISTPTYRSVRTNAGALIINGGEFEGQVWVQPNQGDCTIEVNGGSFAPTGGDGSSIFLTNAGEGKTITSASITGGTFATKIGASDPTALAGAITGGTFTEAAVTGTNAALLGENMSFVSTGDGTYGVAAKATEVATYDELVAALAVGGEIELTADITVDTKITAIDGTVINLNGKTLYINVENSSYNDVTIKNGNIVLGKDDVHTCDGYFLVNAGKTLVLNGVNVTSAEGGIKGYCVFHLKTGANLDLIGSSVVIDGNEYAAGYVVYAGEATATVDVTNSTINGTGVNGIVHATTVIDGSNVTITNPAEHGINRSAVTINDSTVTISGGTGRGITAQHGDLNITGNSVVTISDMGEATIELRGDKNLTVADTATVILDAEVNNTTNGTVTGTVTVKGPVAQIGETTYDDLHEAMVACKAGETVELIADVDLAGTEWEPVSFKGTFDGKDYTISNLTINKPGVSNVGFITSLNGIFKNVTFTNPTVTGGENTGVVAGRAGGSAALAENITVNGTIKVETTHKGYARAGVIVGGWGYGNYKDITVDGGDKAVSYIKHTGGGDGRYVAGIVGHADDVESYVNCTVKNITISGGWLCGGITGPGPSDGLISGCTVENVNIDANYSGGMFGWYYGNGTIENSTIKDVAFVGGTTNNGAIGGYGVNDDATVTNVTIENVTNQGKALLGQVAEINGTFYYSLADAIAAAGNGDTITLIANVNLTEGVTVPADATVTLDLAGYSITGTPSEAAAYAVIKNLGTLTIKGEGSVICDHKLAGSTSYAVNTILNGGTLTIDGASIVNKSTSSNQIGYAIDNNSTSASTVVTIESGSVSASGSNYYDGIRLFCNSTTNENSVTVNGGTVSTIWLQNPSDGAADKNTKDVKGSVAISGGTVNALYLEPSSEFDAAVTGGYVGSISYFQQSEGRDLAGFVTGGTFGADVTAFCAEGFVAKNNGDNTYSVEADPAYGKVAVIGETYYETIDAAITAAQDGDVVTLLTDVSSSEIIVINKAITLDGNDKTLTSTAGRAINVSGADGVTIKNLTINASGERAINVIQNATNVTIDNVTATAANYTVNVASSAPNAVVAIEGSDLTGLNVVNVAAAGANVTINDTTITCNDQTDLESYSALALNKDAKNGTITATNVTFDVKGDSYKAVNGAENGTITIDGSSDEVVVDVAYIQYGDYYYGFTSLAAAFEKAEAGDTIVLLTPVVVEAGETLTLNKDVNITYTSNVVGEDMITVRGILNVAAGTITYVNTDKTGNNVTVSTISCEPGSVLNVTGGTIENKTVYSTGSYAYAIDLLTNGSLGDVTATISGGKVYSDYMAIRQFNNGTACKNTLTVSGGEIYGAKRAIQVHINNNAAYLNISGGKIAAGEGGYALCLFPTTATNIAATGGSFTGAVYSATNGIISGGTYSEELYAAYLAEGFVLNKNADGTYSVVEKPALPTATVGDSDNDDLTFATKFSADPATDAQLAYYGDWYADFVLTFESDVTLNANGGADGYLSGSYEAWQNGTWVNVPFENVTLTGGESLKVMEYAAKMLNQPGLKLTYNDVYNSVKVFDCGVFLEDLYIVEHAGEIVTLELRIYNPADETESYVIGTTYEFEIPELIPELPTATVGDSDNDDLTFATKFSADPATDAQLAYYGDWYADFVLTFESDVTLNANGGADGYLSGSYEAWQNGTWVNVPFEDVTLTGGESLKVMEYAAKMLNQPGLKLTYNDVYNSVKVFDCGVFLEDLYIVEHAGEIVTLELRIYNPADETKSYVIGTTYEFKIPELIPELPTATVGDSDNDDLTFATKFSADPATDAQLAYYGDWYADFVLTFESDVTLNANGGADGYLSGSYEAWQNGTWVNVPFEDVTLTGGESLKVMEYAAKMLNQPGLKLTYNDVYNSVKVFDCGVFLEDLYIVEHAGEIVTLELRIYNPADETESYVIGETYEFVIPEITDAVAMNVQTGKIYSQAMTGLMEAQSGETVVLLKDSTEAYIMVPVGVTFDLDGYTMTANYVSVFGNIVDYSDSNAGVLSVEKDNFLIQSSNTQLPVKTDKGYQFVVVKNIMDVILDHGDEGEEYTFQTWYEEIAHDMLKNGAASTGVSIQVRVTWNSGEDTDSRTFIYSDAFVTKFINSHIPNGGYNNRFQLLVDNPEEFDGLTYTAVIVSDTGVEFSANDY